MNFNNVSIPLGDLTLDQLVQLNQGLGREADKIREQRIHLNRHIAQRLAAGQRNAAPADGDAAAPGAVIEAAVSQG
jgi:hypothetical protein